MEILHFASDGSLVKKISAGYSMQYSDSVVYLFAYVDSITPSDYVATLVCTPNGATESVTLAVPTATQTVDGQSVVGFGLYLPASVLQIAGPLSISLFITSQSGTVLVTFPSTIYVSAAASDEWETPITKSQWQDIVNYVLGCNKGFIGVITSLSVLDAYKSDGSYWFIYNTQAFDFKVVTVDAGGVAQLKVGVTSPSWQSRIYVSSWGPWTDYYNPIQTAGGTFTGTVNFNAVPQVLYGGSYTPVIFGASFQNAFLALVTAANVSWVLGSTPVANATLAASASAVKSTPVELDRQFVSGSASTDTVAIAYKSSYYGSLRFTKIGNTNSGMKLVIAGVEVTGIFTGTASTVYMDVSVSWCPIDGFYAVLVKTPQSSSFYVIAEDSASPDSLIKVFYSGAAFSGTSGYSIQGSLLKLNP